MALCICRVIKPIPPMVDIEPFENRPHQRCRDRDGGPVRSRESEGERAARAAMNAALIAAVRKVAAMPSAIHGVSGGAKISAAKDKP